MKKILFIFLLIPATSYSKFENPEKNLTPEIQNKINQTSQTTITRYNSLGPGINIGNHFESSTFSAQTDIETHAKELWKKGFRHIRLPINWSNNATADITAKIDPKFFQTVELAVQALLKIGFTVIINCHHYRELDGDPPSPGSEPILAQDIKPRFHSIWKQVAEKFSIVDDNKLWFEIYNEPHGLLDAEKWNMLLASSINEIRKTNPTRTLVVGPHKWNSAYALDTLVLPNNDQNIVATIHNYEPFTFTHQQAKWTGKKLSEHSGEQCCTLEQKAKIKAPLEHASKWSQKKKIPVLLGEFGAYKGPKTSPNDPISRANYTYQTRSSAESLGIAWTYWEFDSGFGIFNKQDKTWDEGVLNSLIPSLEIKNSEN